jgi:hypothetical protein
MGGVGIEHTLCIMMFYPSSNLMRHKRQRINWPVVTSVVVAVIACWMIREVHLLHEQRLQNASTEMSKKHLLWQNVNSPTSSISHPHPITRVKEAIMSSKHELTKRP